MNLVAADPNDIQLMNILHQQFYQLFSLGAYYYTKKYFIGISMPMFLSYELDQSTGKYKIDNNFSGSNYFFTTGYEMA